MSLFADDDDHYKKIIDVMWEAEKQRVSFASEMWKRWEQAENALQMIATAENANADDLRAAARGASWWLRKQLPES